MKTPLLAAALVLAAAVPAAQAADDYGLTGSTYDWSGGYVGMNAGMGFNMSKFTADYSYVGSVANTQVTDAEIDALDYSRNIDDTVFTGGISAGYNWQFGSFVFGLEGDYNYLGFNGTVKRNADDQINGILSTETTGTYDKVDYQGDWYGTARARMGFASDNFLVYGTGGLAYGELDVTQSLARAASAESIAWNGGDNGWNLGWTIGGGMEYGVDRWTLGLEYLYVDLSSYGWNSLADVNLVGTNAGAEGEWAEVRQSGTADYRFGVARATIKYRF